MSEQTGSWQPDPFGRHQYRYWDGAEWSDQVSNDGVVSTDPATADVGAGADAPGSGGPVAGDEPVASEPVPPAEPAGWAAAPPPDATAAMPAAAPAAYAGGPGAPTGPTEPPATGGGSNLPGILVGVAILAILLGVGAYFLFFSGDDDDDARATVIAGLRSEMGLTNAQANCVADELSDSIGLSTVAEAMEDDRDPSASQMVAILNAFDECDIDALALGDGDTDTDTDTSAPDPSDLQIPPALLAMMAQEMATELGITADQAECVLTGIMTGFSTEQFEDLLTNPEGFSDLDGMGTAMQVFDECGVDPNQFSGGGGGTTGAGSDYGDDPVLDALWDACDDGDMESCDDLYFDSPFGSEYETFGDTCGGRQAEGTGNLCVTEFG